MNSVRLILPWNIFVKILLAYIVRAIGIWFFMYFVGYFFSKMIIFLNFTLSLNLNTEIPPFKYLLRGSIIISEFVMNVIALKLAIDSYLHEVKNYFENSSFTENPDDNPVASL